MPFLISLLVLLLFICSIIQGVGDRKRRRNMRKEKLFIHFDQDILKVHSIGSFFFFFASHYMNISFRKKKKSDILILSSMNEVVLIT